MNLYIDINENCVSPKKLIESLNSCNPKKLRLTKFWAVY